jgi:hypothetical protein
LKPVVGKYGGECREPLPTEELTFDIQREKGRPPSLAKAHVSLDTVVTAVMLPDRINKKRNRVRKVLRPFDPVFVNAF